MDRFVVQRLSWVAFALISLCGKNLSSTTARAAAEFKFRLRFLFRFLFGLL